MTPVDTLGEPVTVVDALGEPVVLINNDGTPAFLAYSAKTYLGGVAPYHWLDFINNRALYAGADVGNVTQATGYSFTRASDGYYTNADGTLTLFGSGALRRGDRGVLIEGSRTNLLVRSQEFQTTWSAVGLQAFGSGSTANAGVSPDGTTTADLLTESSANSRHFIFQLQSVSASTTYAYSVYLKYSTRRYCVVSLKSYTGSVDVVSYSQVVDVQNRTLGAATNTTGSPTNTSSTIELLANGWCRVNITMNTGVGGVLMYSSVCLSDSATPSYVAEAPSYTGDGTSGVLAWQADLQAGAFPSSPIVTVAAAATRASDVLTYTVNTTAQINAAVAGQAELVTNGAFATDTGWTKGTGWTITGGAASFTATGAASALSQSISGVTAGKAYVIQYTVVSNTLNAGNFRVGAFSGNAAFGSSVINLPITVGAHSVLVLPTPAGAGNILDTHVSAAATSGTLTIDNLSIKEVPANSLTLYPIQLWSEFERAVDTGADEIVANFNATASDRTDLYVSSADLVRVFMRAASATQADVATSGSIAINTVTKAAARAATNDVNIAKDGTAATADTTATLPTNPTELRIGLRVDGAQPLFGYIRRIAVIQGAGTDAQLQSMTS
jgi:hypothetical protein